MKVKTLCIICAVTWLVPIGGCGTDSAGRLHLAEKALAITAEQSALLDGRLAAIEAVLAQGQVALADPNLSSDITDRINAALARARAELAVVRPIKAKFDEVAVQLQAKVAELQAGGDVDFTDELQVIATLLGTAGPVVGGQTGQWMALAATLIGLIVGVFAKVQTVKKNQAQTAVTELVAGGQRFKREVERAPAESGTVLFAKAMGEEQKSAATRELVAIARTKVRV